MTRLKFAELTSVVGVLVLGLGLGATLSRWVGPTAAPIIILGIAIHAVGMRDKHRLESEGEARRAGWIVALYWACWLLLAVLLVLVLLWIR